MEPPFRNGLSSRTREKKVGGWLTGIFGFYLISMFLVPALLPANSVPELSGRANTLDYYDEDGWGNKEHPEGGGMGHNQSEHGVFEWSNLSNPYYSFVYAFGDFNCHQKHERSWEINGNQMPVCVRDVGIFLGLTIGAWWWSRRGLNRWTLRDSFLTLLPDSRILNLYLVDRRMITMLAIGLGMSLPLVLDGGIQALTSYESVNPMRLATGIPFGFIISWFFAASLSSRPVDFEGNPSKVKLPSGARLMSEKPSDESE